MESHPSINKVVPCIINLSGYSNNSLFYDSNNLSDL